MRLNSICSSSENDITKSNHKLVWDILVRLFHWVLATSFVVAFITEDELVKLHAQAGYLILGLLFIRFIWGFIGPRFARWSDFVKPPAEIIRYLTDMVQFRAKRHLGHNPAGGAMIVALVISLGVTGVSGLALYGAQDLSGPLASVMRNLPMSWGEPLEESHEALANLTLLLVFIHLAGVVAASLQHRENLVKAMITGQKRENVQ